MIQKIQTLQKRLIGKTEEVVEKDLLIQVGLLGPWLEEHGLACVCVCPGGRVQGSGSKAAGLSGHAAPFGRSHSRAHGASVCCCPPSHPDAWCRKRRSSTWSSRASLCASRGLRSQSS
jgi:hypothetical protein